MTDDVANEPFARLFEYNAWANALVIDACRDLGDGQLDAPGIGAFGSIRDTLLHVIFGQYSFLARLEGRAQDPRSLAPSWQGFDALSAAATETSAALGAVAATMGKDSDVVLSYMGKNSRYPRSFFLVHAAAHGVEHRTQIGMMLDRLGHPRPNLDAWEFASAEGLGVET